MQSDVPLVGVVMGSDSDWPVMGAAAEVLDEFGVAYEADVVSAHRMPREMIAYGEQAASRGLKVIIAGAGGAAHLPGMLASVTPLPVIGVPVPLKYLDGMDSLLSIVQMPAGIPVATVAVGGARNAGLLAVRILAAADDELRAQMIEFQARLTAQAKAKGAALREKLLSPRRRPEGDFPGRGDRPSPRWPPLRARSHQPRSHQAPEERPASPGSPMPSAEVVRGDREGRARAGTRRRRAGCGAQAHFVV